MFSGVPPFTQHAPVIVMSHLVPLALQRVQDLFETTQAGLTHSKHRVATSDLPEVWSAA